MLYITSPWFIYFITGSLYLLTPLTYYTSPHFPPLAATNLFSVSMSSVFLCFLFLDSTCKWGHMVFVVLCLTYFIYHNAFKSHPCCHKWQKFFFYCCIIVYCICVSSPLLYPFIHQWTLSLLPWTWGCIYLFKLVFLFFRDKCPEVELLEWWCFFCAI